MAESKKLDLYRKKRDFTKTAEPAGRTRVDKVEAYRFVIHKHAATRLHYDLRLEVDGVFRSWAVTRGPSLDPHEKRLAVEVEDHPLDYGDFEGTIPKGEYGGGTVMVWDRGYWAPDDGGDPAEALKAGELKFTMMGEKLKGGFVIVRMKFDRNGGKHTNWLLIKHRDEYARESGDILTEDKSVASSRSMEQIAAGKGRAAKPFMKAAKRAAPKKAPAKKKAVRKRAASLKARTATAHTSSRMPRFIEPQLCTLVSRAPDGPQWLHEVKYDGYRMQLRVEHGAARLFTRKGFDWSAKMQRTVDAGENLPDCIIDGELVVLDEKGLTDFSGLQAALSGEGAERLVYFAFDLLHLQGRDLRGHPLEARKAALAKLLNAARVAPAIRYAADFAAQGAAVQEAACRMSLEGVVSKRRDAPYRSGRSATWTKAKCRAGQEVVIGGWSSEAGRFRSLLVGVRKRGKLVYAGRVGTGYGGKVAEQLTGILKAYSVGKSPFESAAPVARNETINWVKPDLVAEIEFAGWTGSHMVRQASFKGLRGDKPAAEVKMERAKPALVKKGVSVAGVAISHPDKPYWPGLTKRDLIEYLAQMGEHMLPHLAGRPCSLVRAPDGVDGQQFFQRHAMAGVSKAITQVKIAGDKEPYLQFDSIEALVAAGQSGAIEFHPWNCLPGKPEEPGRLVFDLDPGPGVDFTDIIAAAKEAKARLEEKGLAAFLKTTGGKGLHVVTPLAARRGAKTTWAEAKAFARDLCAEMAAESPDAYVVNMSKKLRDGRIFLDYLRNDRTATAVAPFSPRARDGATVSMPITWGAATKRLDPARFTIETAKTLMKADAWAGYDKAAKPLPKKR